MARMGKPRSATRISTVPNKQLGKVGKNKYTGTMPQSQVPASPQQVQDARTHPITDKPSPTDPHWGTSLGVSMLNSNNPYENMENVNG